MLGAIIGDIAGSRFEWHNIKSKTFVKFSPQEYYYQDVFELVDYTYEDDRDEAENIR